jgi:hypothetical protein
MDCLDPTLVPVISTLVPRRARRNKYASRYAKGALVVTLDPVVAVAGVMKKTDEHADVTRARSDRAVLEEPGERLPRLLDF